MASSRLAYLFLIACSLQLVFCSEYVPVYMWGDLEIDSQKANPLTLVKREEFEDLLKEQFDNDPFTVVFIENNLSVEDLSRKNAKGENSFPYLQANLGDALYFPNVQSTLNALNNMADPKKVDHVKLTENGLSAEIESNNGRFLFITLKDAKEGESRSAMLRRHNDFIEDMFAKLQEKYDKVIGVYTAHYPSWVVSHSRVRRQAVGESDVISLPNMLFYVKNITVKEGDVENAFAVTGSESTSDDSSIRAVLRSADATLTLLFTRNAGYWFFNMVTIKSGQEEVDAVEENQIYAIEGFSYRCSQNLKYVAVNATKEHSVTFTDLQIQPFWVQPDSPAFGDAYFCVGFTSVPIWACLFVTIILFSIMLYGVVTMMDIRTMDRFDDPKGKTISVNAGD